MRKKCISEFGINTKPWKGPKTEITFSCNAFFCLSTSRYHRVIEKGDLDKTIYIYFYYFPLKLFNKESKYQNFIVVIRNLGVQHKKILRACEGQHPYHIFLKKKFFFWVTHNNFQIP